MTPPDFVYRGVKFILAPTQATTGHDSCDGCAFRNDVSACTGFLNHCNLQIFVPDPDPINLTTYRLTK